MGLLNRVPWWAKVGAKIVLSRLPVPYKAWRAMGLFRHGETNLPIRALQTFSTYYSKITRYKALEPGFTSLELGPGDSVLTGLVASAFGASTVYLVDRGPYAETDLGACLKLSALLEQSGRPLPDLSMCKSIDDVMARCNVRYIVTGTEGMRKIPDASVDVMWSQVVLEHIRLVEVPIFMAELRRVAKVGSIGYHSVDFRDHLGGGLNHLRFSRSVWESEVFANSGFYTNRLRLPEMLNLFGSAGFDVDVPCTTTWPEMPLSRGKICQEFQDFEDDTLRIAEAELVVRPAGTL